MILTTDSSLYVISQEIFCKFSTRQEVKRAILEYIEGFYNRKRLHSTLGYLSPEAFEDFHKEKQRICS